MRVKALQSGTYILETRTLTCEAGEEYELTVDEIRRVPSGYFQVVSDRCLEFIEEKKEDEEDGHTNRG